MEGIKHNKVEADKRVEILNEFIWWLFECFVIPLLRVLIETITYFILNILFFINTEKKFLILKCFRHAFI